MTKTALQQLVIKDDLDALAEALLEWAKRANAAALHRDALIEAGRLAAQQKSRMRGNVSESDLTLQRNDVRVALLELLDPLPETPVATAALQPRVMTETNFKWFVLAAMLVGNAAAFGCLFILGEGAGGFTPPEASTTATMLISVCGAYLSVVVGDLIARRGEAEPSVTPRLSGRFVGLSAGLLAFYFIAVCWLINRRPLMEFQSFIGWLTALESGLGLLVGQLINSVFKKNAALD